MRRKTDAAVGGGDPSSSSLSQHHPCRHPHSHRFSEEANEPHRDEKDQSRKRRVDVTAQSGVYVIIIIIYHHLHINENITITTCCQGVFPLWVCWCYLPGAPFPTLTKYIHPPLPRLKSTQGPTTPPCQEYLGTIVSCCLPTRDLMNMPRNRWRNRCVPPTSPAICAG